MIPPIVHNVGQARLDDLHRQAERDAQVAAARRAHRAHRAQEQRLPSGHGLPGLLAVIAPWIVRP
jgi:hypothetical protein